MLDGGVAFFFLFTLLVHYLTAYQHEYGQADKGDDSDCSAEIDDESNEETDGERRSGSNEPTADNAQHTGDTEYGGVASPGTVGEGSTHGNHESHRPASTRLTEARTK